MSHPINGWFLFFSKGESIMSNLRYVYLVEDNNVWMEVHSVKNGRCIEVRHEHFNNGYIEFDKSKYTGRTRDLYFMFWHDLYDEVVEKGTVSQEEFIEVMQKLGFEQVDEL